MFPSTTVLDPRLNREKALAPLPVTANDRRFEENLQNFRNKLYENVGGKQQLNILKDEFRKLRETGDTNPTEYELVIGDLIAKSYGRYAHMDSNFFKNCQCALEKILFLAKNNSEIKGRLKKLGKDLYACGPGTGTMLFNIIYILTVQPGFEHWLPQLRYTIVERLASEYIVQKRPVGQSSDAGRIWENHVGLAFHQYAERYQLNIPYGAKYAEISEIYDIREGVGLSKGYKKSFIKKFYAAYTYEAILEAVHVRYDNLLREYSKKNNLDSDSLDGFTAIIQPFIDFGIFNLADALMSQEGIETPNTEKHIREDFFPKLKDFCEALLYHQGYFTSPPSLFSIATTVEASYLNKKSKPTKFKKKISPIVNELDAIENFERLTIKDRRELQFSLIKKELAKIKKNLSFYQRIKRYWGFNKKTDRETILEEQCTALSNKHFGQLPEDEVNQLHENYESFRALKADCLKMFNNKRPPAELQNLMRLEKLIENSEITLTTLKKHKNNFSLIIQLDSDYLVANRLDLILSRLDEINFTNNFVILLNKIKILNGVEKGFELTEKIVSIHHNIFRRDNKNPLNFKELLDFPENYFIPFLFDTLPHSWFLPDNITLLRKILVSLNERENQEESILSFFAQSNLPDLFKKIISLKDTEEEGIQCIKSIVLTAKNMESKLSVSALLELPRNYLIPDLFKQLHDSWFSEKNILLLKELLTILKNSSDQEEKIIHFLASHNSEEFTLFMRNKIILACENREALTEISNKWEQYKEEETHTLAIISEMREKKSKKSKYFLQRSDAAALPQNNLDDMVEYCRKKIVQHTPSSNYAFWKKAHHAKRRAHYQDMLNACKPFVEPISETEPRRTIVSQA
jgi:hypothetical protein